MMNIKINNPAIELTLKQTYGENVSFLLDDFVQFVQHKRIQQDVSVSIQEIESGQAIPIQEAFSSVRDKYW